MRGRVPVLVSRRGLMRGLWGVRWGRGVLLVLLLLLLLGMVGS